MESYIHQPLSELVNELESRNLSTLGNKSILIKRLAVYDKDAAAKKFAQFSRFPIEIQMLIWYVP